MYSRTGSCIVPLHISQSETQLNYFVDNSNSKLILTSNDNHNFYGISKEKNLQVLNVSNFLNYDYDSPVDTRAMKKSRHSIIFYTSGTTGKPKGVVHTFQSLDRQISSQLSCWHWSKIDNCLHCLPLNHLHGLVNALLTPLSIGARCHMLPSFQSDQVWLSLMEQQITVFTGVPTMYSKLIQSYNSRRPKTSSTRNKSGEFIRATMKNNIRLMMSGSAPLTNRLRQEWEDISGINLLERYGSSEAGIVLSQAYHNRTPGNVGLPLVGVECAVARPNVYSANGYDILATANHIRTTSTDNNVECEGELLVKSKGMFKEYYGLDKLINEQFTKDGWFKSGDTVRIVDGNIQILGRTSVDIIKSGGYKISALEVERTTLEYDQVIACCVVGVADPTWGQKVAALIVPADQFDQSKLHEHFKENLSSYEIPTVIKFVDRIETNSMGKINKKEILNTFFEEESKQYF